jgi:hypothetical protein
MKLYKAIVWIGQAPGLRVTVEAETGEQARRQLRATYGDEAVRSI